VVGEPGLNRVHTYFSGPLLLGQHYTNESSLSVPEAFLAFSKCDFKNLEIGGVGHGGQVYTHSKSEITLDTKLKLKICLRK
jgi:hypothetical protein